MPAIDQITVNVGEIDLHVALCGPTEGPLLVLLHGFPELSYAWHRHIQPLAVAGWRVAAPDQRGYGLSGKPAHREAYVVDRLARDVTGLADALGHQRFALVGHDWGGVVAWHLLSARPERVSRAAILNAPSLSTMSRHMRSHPSQLLKSWYVAAFLMPGVSEALLGAADHRLLVAALRVSSRKGTFSAEDIAVYRRAWSMEGALTGMLNWYRALPLDPVRPPERITQPVLVLWGDKDVGLDSRLAERTAACCDHAEVVHFPEASHWLQHEEAERVNTRLLQFLSPELASPRPGET